MGINVKYRKGDCFLAKIVSVENDDGKEEYIVSFGGKYFRMTKENLDTMVCIPVYYTTGKIEKCKEMHKEMIQKEEEK